MEQAENVFRRRYDVYYVTLLVYVVFAVLYILLTGTVTNETVAFGFRDPVVYIIGLFILITGLALLSSVVRNPRLVLTESQIVFRTRFRERAVQHAQITSLVIKRERTRINEGSSAVVKIRVRDKRRLVRIRVANYERDRELVDAFKALKNRLRK